MTGHNLSKSDKGALTFHGLRHSWANKRYNELVQSGLSDKDSRAIVSSELGHGRESVTQIYIPRAGSGTRID